MKDKEHRERLPGTQIEGGEYKEVAQACRHLAPKAFNFPFNKTQEMWITGGDTKYTFTYTHIHIYIYTYIYMYI